MRGTYVTWLGGQEEGEKPHVHYPPPTPDGGIHSGCSRWLRAVRQRGPGAGATMAARGTESSSSSDTNVNGTGKWALAFCSGERRTLMVAAAVALLWRQGW